MACVMLLSTSGATTAADRCDGPQQVREATLDEIKAYVLARRMAVLTFIGYSGAGYQQPRAMLQQASSVLSSTDPTQTIVNIGATADGIGAVYEVAKHMGFSTMGIVSTQAREQKVPLSPCVDHVFFVRDDTWGGQDASTGALSPTSAAMVAASTSVVGIGGGEVGRDELLAARQAGLPVRFMPADMDHQRAIDKARKRGQPTPTQFRGAAHEALAADR